MRRDRMEVTQQGRGILETRGFSGTAEQLLGVGKQTPKTKL